MKKGKARIIIGLVLIFLQLLSVLGNAKSGIGISLSFENFSVFLYDLLFLLGYLWIGVIGSILLISGLIAYNKKPNGLNNGELENNSCENKEESTEKFQQNSDLDIDKMSPQDAAEYLFAERLGEKYIPKEKQDKKIKIKYCSQCGSPIDSLSKKCTGCGKQYFKGFRFAIFSVTVIALALVIVTISTLYVLQYINTQELKGEISTKQSTVIRLENEIDDLEKELNNYKGYRVDYIIATNHLEFYEKYAVLVNENSNKYHKYGCDDFDESYFWIFNIDYAKQQGYYACSKCH